MLTTISTDISFYPIVRIQGVVFILFKVAAQLLGGIAKT